ncbi:MAG: LemA family protein [Methanomassiliicoccaceae archaeon]|jgi:LemA protein|nr:LemA family protein [Methanomassiliicoccaceae archaeon]
MELWIIGILGIVLIFVIVAVLFYNSFIKKKLKVENNFSEIKIQCKKRFDLVPNLVETVKGYAQHEKETLEKVTIARSAGVTAQSVRDLANANNQLTQTLNKLFALGEQYPDLKANINFGKLQDELVEIEKTIAISRSFYNDAVMMYNRAIKVIPANMFASMFKFKEAEFFNAPEAELENVKVKF